MSWVAVGGAVVGVAGQALSKDKGGGAGTTTASKDPWAPAAPWLESQIKTGQGLQAQYQQNPFNAQQLASYENMGRQTDYMNNLVPSLLGQISGQGQLGFDRSNTNGRVTPYTFDGMGSSGGLLSSLSNPATVASSTSAANPAPVATTQAPGNFTQQTAETGPVVNGLYLTTDPNKPTAQAFGNGAYGSFQYGQQPEKGTQAYRDLQEYLAWGGEDPYGLYGGQSKYLPTNFSMQQLGGMNSGDSVGGSAAGDGSGGGAAGGTSW